MRHKSLSKQQTKQVIDLLSSTRFSCTEIGKWFGISRGPISEIHKKYHINRQNARRTGQELPCYTCGKLFYKSKAQRYKGRGKFCSKDCYSTWQSSEENKGHNHPGWIDGGQHESELNKLRKSSEWAIWRNIVFERDNFTCQLCGTKGGRLHPHHIIKKADDSSKIFEPLNGLTLCCTCHMTKGIHKQCNLSRRILNTIAVRNTIARLSSQEASLMHV